MTTYRVWKPHFYRWVLIEEQSGTLYDAHRTGAQFTVMSSSGLAKGEYESVYAAVSKFMQATADVERPEGMVLKVSV